MSEVTVTQDGGNYTPDDARSTLRYLEVVVVEGLAVGSILAFHEIVRARTGVLHPELMIGGSAVAVGATTALLRDNLTEFGPGYAATKKLLKTSPGIDTEANSTNTADVTPLRDETIVGAQKTIRALRNLGVGWFITLGAMNIWYSQGGNRVEVGDMSLHPAISYVPAILLTLWNVQQLRSSYGAIDELYSYSKLAGKTNDHLKSRKKIAPGKIGRSRIH